MAKPLTTTATFITETAWSNDYFLFFFLSFWMEDDHENFGALANRTYYSYKSPTTNT